MLWYQLGLWWMILSHSSTICFIWQPRFDLCSGMVPGLWYFSHPKECENINTCTCYVYWFLLFVHCYAIFMKRSYFHYTHLMINLNVVWFIKTHPSDCFCSLQSYMQYLYIKCRYSFTWIQRKHLLSVFVITCE